MTFLLGRDRIAPTEAKEDVKVSEHMHAGRIPQRIIKCGCTGSGAALFQDETYGAGNRVHNGSGGKTSRSSKPVVFRCTVCGTERGG